MLASIFFTGCGSQPSTTTSTASAQSASTASQAFKVDWKKCFDDLKPHIVGGDYEYVKDAYIEVDEKSKMITFTAIFDDAAKPSLAPQYADMMLRQFNTTAAMQDSSISGGTKDSRGGLYDVYQAFIGIAPESQQDNKSKWFVYDTIGAKVQTAHEIKLQPAYQ